MSDARIYIVRDSANGKVCLVRASSQAKAKAYVAKTIVADVATQDDLVRELTAGTELHDATVNGEE